MQWHCSAKFEVVYKPGFTAVIRGVYLTLVEGL